MQLYQFERTNIGSLLNFFLMPFYFLFIITILKVKKNFFFFVLQWIMPTYVKAMLLVYNSIVIELQKQWSYK